MSVTYPRSSVSVDSLRYLLPMWSAVLLTEALVVVVYFHVSSAEPGSIRYLVYPFVWINVAVWAVYRTVTVDRPNAGADRPVLGAGVAIGYFLLLLGLSGLVSIHWFSATDVGTQIVWAAPGWGPMVIYGGSLFTISLIPFQVAGYASLSYLVYVHLQNTVRQASVGIPALLSCVGCAAPLLLAMGGSGGTLVARLAQWSYDIGTIVFVVTALLLVIALEWGDERARCREQ